MMQRRKREDDELVKMILLGGKEMNEAIEYILAQNADKIIEYLVKQNCGKEEAQDVLYEGLSIFIMTVRVKKFQADSSIYTYLTAICKRIWFKKFNRKVLHQKWEMSVLRESKTSYETSFEENVITKELSEGLEFLMNHLKAKCKEVLRLWSLSYSIEEIQNKLGYSSRQVVANKKNLCLKELRKQLNDHPELKDLII